MVSKEEIPQYDKEQVKHVKGVLRDSIEMLEQVGLPVFPGDPLCSSTQFSFPSAIVAFALFLMVLTKVFMTPLLVLS